MKMTSRLFFLSVGLLLSFGGAYAICRYNVGAAADYMENFIGDLLQQTVSSCSGCACHENKHNCLCTNKAFQEGSKWKLEYGNQMPSECDDEKTVIFTYDEQKETKKVGMGQLISESECKTRLCPHCGHPVNAHIPDND